MGVVTAERRGDDWESARKAAERRELRAVSSVHFPFLFVCLSRSLRSLGSGVVPLLCTPLY
jgi:hypothetical protein